MGPNTWEKLRNAAETSEMSFFMTWRNSSTKSLVCCVSRQESGMFSHPRLTNMIYSVADFLFTVAPADVQKFCPLLIEETRYSEALRWGRLTTYPWFRDSLLRNWVASFPPYEKPHSLNHWTSRHGKIRPRSPAKLDSLPGLGSDNPPHCRCCPSLYSSRRNNTFLWHPVFPLSFRPSGLTFLRVKTDNIENKDLRNAVNKYLNIGEWVIDQSVAFMSTTSYFERKRWFRGGPWPGRRSPWVCDRLQWTDVSFQAIIKWVDVCLMLQLFFKIYHEHLLWHYCEHFVIVPPLPKRNPLYARSVTRQTGSWILNM